ncbi:MAG: DUF882 domain-containing protein [Candidatus Margulisiibacteriota bacterium]
MGDLSEHFNYKDFNCKCPQCKGEGFKIHLGLVGALEMIAEHFQKQVKVISAFWCDDYYESLKREKVSYHLKGKAVHIAIDGVPPNELFKYAETIPEINGIGLYPQEGFVHLDTRPLEKRDLWVKDGERYIPLTPEKRKQYGL